MGTRRWLWLAVGVVASLLAVGGRWDIPLAAWLAPVFLLRFTRTSPARTGLAMVWLASWAAALFWVWELAVPVNGMIVLATALFGTVLALPYIADRLLAPRLGTAGELLLFPMAVTVCQFLLGVFAPFGAVLGILANTQHDNLGFLQVISVIGPYGIGFLIGACATVANRARPSWRVAGTYVAVLAVVVVGGALRLALFPVDTTQTVRIAGINPSMSSVGSPAVIDELFDKTRHAAQAGAKIVVWSENAARLSAAELPGFIAEARNVARQEHIYLDVADNISAPAQDETHLIGPDGTVLWTYQKAHPIPGLEPYTPGDGVVPVVTTPYGRIANVICYDADFPAMMHVDADIMLVPGGDWPQMGRTHTQMAGLRAVENGYSLVRQDYDGWSEAFDSNGHALSTQDTTVDHDLWLVDVPTHGVTTVYRVIGDVFAWLCVAGVIILIGLGVVRRRTPMAPEPVEEREANTAPVPAP